MENLTVNARREKVLAQSVFVADVARTCTRCGSKLVIAGMPGGNGTLFPQSREKGCALCSQGIPGPFIGLFGDLD